MNRLAGRLGPVAPRWWALAALVALLRLPLWSLPALGRDEALYLYWSRHFEIAYSPLLQLALRAVDAVGVDAAWLWRVPVVATGVLLLGLFDRLLCDRGVGADGRFLAVAAVALSPWQTHTASVVHPDGFMVAALLGLAWAGRHDRMGMAATCALLALAAKPSGLLAVVVTAGALAWRTRAALTRRRAAVTLTLLVVLAAVPLSQWNRSMVEAVRQFGLVSESVPPVLRAARALVGLLFVGGPILLVALVRGAAERRRPTELDLGAALGWAYLLAFSAAALLFGQIKANWILPAALLLWPTGLDLRRVWVRAGMGVQIVLAIGVTLAFSAPQLVRSLERGGSPAFFDYHGFAGQREEEVAPAERWWHRLAVYQGLGSLPEEILARVPDGVELLRVRSDDYGLAAQLVAEIQTLRPNPDLRLVLPLDPLFVGTTERDDREGATLLLAVQRRVEDLHASADTTFGLTHPITGERIECGLVLPSPKPSSRKG